MVRLFAPVLAVVVGSLAGCHAPTHRARPAHAELAEPPSQARAPASPEAEADVAPVAAPAPLEPLPALVPWESAPDDVYVVSESDGRTFVALEVLDQTERQHPDSLEFDHEAIEVTPSDRVVPGQFRLVGPNGACDGEAGRAVILTTHSIGYSERDDAPPPGQPDPVMATSYRFSAVEVDATCTAQFAVPASVRGALSWTGPEITQRFEPGVTGEWTEEGTPVVQEPRGMQGRLGPHVTFEEHATCEAESTLEMRVHGRRVRLEWSGHYAVDFGLLEVGRRRYFAESAYSRWTFTPLGPAAQPAPIVDPSGTSGDYEHVEMEVWYCTEEE